MANNILDKSAMEAIYNIERQQAQMEKDLIERIHGIEKRTEKLEITTEKGLETLGAKLSARIDNLTQLVSEEPTRCPMRDKIPIYESTTIRQKELEERVGDLEEGMTEVKTINKITTVLNAAWAAVVGAVVAYFKP